MKKLILLKHPMLALVALGMLPGVHPAFAQTWTQTSAPITNWTSVASSADGAKLVAAPGETHPFGFAGPPGPIYISTDSGATWTAATAPTTNWISVASSADGTNLVAAAGGVYSAGPIYTSTNSGATWTATSAPSTNWTSIASSADGAKLVAVSVVGAIYTSADFGATWMPWMPSMGGAFWWNSVASSADGTKLVAAAASEDSPVYTSTNSGATWMPSIGTSSDGWSSVASSADGTKLLLAARNGCYQSCGGPILASTNAGATWTATSAPGARWSSVAASADRTTLVAASSGGPIYTSSDSGTTWAAASAPATNWTSVASSADGSKLVAVANGGGIWTSQSTPAPLLSITSSYGNVVLSWTVPSMDYLLQENSDLTTTNWMDVTNAPTLNLTNLQNQVSLSSPVGSRFYRLKSP